MKLFYSTLLILTVVWSGFLITTASKPQPTQDTPETPLTSTSSSPLAMEYIVEGTTYTFVDGKAILQPSDALYTSLSLFGDPSYGDIDNDGDSDALSILVAQSAGTGVFYYAVIALNKDMSYTSSNAVLLGDRIALQNYTIKDGNAIVNYATRKDDEPFSVEPSLGKTELLIFNTETQQLTISTSTPSSTTNNGTSTKSLIPMESTTTSSTGQSSTASAQQSATLPLETEWKWSKTSLSGSTVQPKQQVFTLTFSKDGHFSAKTDCNGIGGDYILSSENSLTLKNMIMTMMFCEGSQEQEYSSMLNNVERYTFDQKGNLLLHLSQDGGVMLFTKTTKTLE
jgi:heat shock protein HslJ